MHKFFLSPLLLLLYLVSLPFPKYFLFYAIRTLKNLLSSFPPLSQFD